MADFKPIFDKVMILEGGYNLHEIEGDRGGMTYAGIARKFWPKWPGWNKIDINEYDSELTSLVREFYQKHFWDKMYGDDIKSQIVAFNIFDFAVNAGIKTSVCIAQRIVMSQPDGVFGAKTLRLLNDMVEDEKDERIFVTTFALLKIFRYNTICTNDKRKSNDKLVSNIKFIKGWINRVQRGLE